VGIKRMSLSSTTYDAGSGIRITVTGRFDFSCHQEFRAAYGKNDPLKSHYTIDLSGADYIDSSALGMLLVLRERSGGDNSNIRIIGFNQSVGEILRIAGFGHLFQMDPQAK